MANVAMVVTNACDPDPRVIQSARWLTEQGHQVTIHAYDRQQISSALSIIDDVKIIRYHLGKSPYGGLLKTGLGIRKFHKSVFSTLSVDSPDVVVCHDADTLGVGCRIKQKLGIKLVFDMHDLQHTWVLMPNPKSLIRKAISNVMQRKLFQRIKHGDQIFTSSGAIEGGTYPGFKEWLLKHGHDSTVIENRPELAEQIPLPNSQNWTVSHIGRIRDLASIKLLLEAIKLIPESQRPVLHIAGDGTEYDQVKREIEQFSDKFGLKYVIGKSFQKDDIRSMLEQTNIMYAMYNPERGNIADGALSTKMFDAASLGIPSIVNADCLMGEICVVENLGISVNWGNSNDLKNALVELKKSRIKLEKTVLEFKTEYMKNIEILLRD
ncbi:MAG: glycosyltransferase [Candidatus Poseidoniaceae archaeon]|nr:glycosyltransferase [Candidatus Poseidoniaceae archaeon]